MNFAQWVEQTALNITRNYTPDDFDTQVQVEELEGDAECYPLSSSEE